MNRYDDEPRQRSFLVRFLFCLVILPFLGMDLGCADEQQPTIDDSSLTERLEALEDQVAELEVRADLVESLENRVHSLELQHLVAVADHQKLEAELETLRTKVNPLLGEISQVTYKVETLEIQNDSQQVDINRLLEYTFPLRMAFTLKGFDNNNPYDNEIHVNGTLNATGQEITAQSISTQGLYATHANLSNMEVGFSATFRYGINIGQDGTMHFGYNEMMTLAGYKNAFRVDHDGNGNSWVRVMANQGLIGSYISAEEQLWGKNIYIDERSILNGNIENSAMPSLFESSWLAHASEFFKIFQNPIDGKWYIQVEGAHLATLDGFLATGGEDAFSVEGDVFINGEGNTPVDVYIHGTVSVNGSLDANCSYPIASCNAQP
ncbi:MAG: hypothetical protein CO030_03595 [Candidatus Magasanikbacteria bacterium CG_4_9_14_0_2_um_filter_42_11]|uniref:Uncharacterized protein n=1 Tax=Candidatus Magasanikbacteria bacterium CG_4_9_14_0_2_um_filter_42_11 TaxID=1974643 RepID=A0A2M8F976_9BACT|nr:MAG: hypothetical protein COU34_03935 [Candidatus Magasanikbacteria bacterium CG10_big_fil_rev_8_21_14_0_10_43_9]PIY92809.1 MAG: hypothetical protein COY70_01305 [Candidatus Magasanikbacteria bacterium CG_4_10_14_0_8_um_filter_42_12]PJC52304.1 MAG: hypothetical protein CO030_03595 [Candidatus Magasanikbacteria bacterium CG_4_9_14_0_2_um_filter_42_11]